ncbi:MAG: hypothetical protein ACPGWM_07380 [Flavobacteriales bacterium]
MIAGHQVNIKLSRSRQSKWGDFKAMRNGTGTPDISVNSDLTPPAFLITFVHEWAHYMVWKNHSSAKAHGIEWKTNFISLMSPFLNEHCFEKQLLPVVKTYFNNPSAAISSAPALYHALAPPSDSQVAVQELKIGDHFSFRGKLYKRLEKRRTRIKCELVGQKKIYLFSQNALVQAQPNDQ